MSVELLDGATICEFVEDERAFGKSIEDRFAGLDADHDGHLSYVEMAGELRSLRVLETHFGVDEVSLGAEELRRVYESLFEQFDHDGNGTVDLAEFKEETRKMMLAVANDVGFLPVQMVLEEGSILKKAVERESAKHAGSRRLMTDATSRSRYYN